MQVAVKFVLIFLCKAKILSVRDLTLVQGAMDVADISG